MGVGRRLIQRRHKLQDDVTDNVPGRERIEKLDSTLNSSPSAYGLSRKYRRRQDRNFGKDSLNRKLEVAWEIDAVIERVDFGGADFGLRITLPSSSEVLARGFKPGDELRILEKSSALSGDRFVAKSEANSGDVASGFVRIVSATIWRLPDIASWVDELSDRVRVEIGSGARLKNV